MTLIHTELTPSSWPIPTVAQFQLHPCMHTVVSFELMTLPTLVAVGELCYPSSSVRQISFMVNNRCITRLHPSALTSTTPSHDTVHDTLSIELFRGPGIDVSKLYNSDVLLNVEFYNVPNHSAVCLGIVHGKSSVSAGSAVVTVYGDEFVYEAGTLVPKRF